MYGQLLQTGVSAHWWLTGWVASIAMLLIGFIIAQWYYDGATGGEPA